MKRLFFTADHHFGHANIIRFSNRPFGDVDEMNEALIERWNERVSPDDDVYHLGDVGICRHDALMPILEELNGRIHLIKGNHENAALRCSDRFEWIKDYYELKVKDEEAKSGYNKIMLFHYAMRTWRGSHHGTWHLYGHSHGNLEDWPDQHCFDVGVDCHDYYPISYEEVKARMNLKTWEPPFKNENR